MYFEISSLFLPGPKKDYIQSSIIPDEYILVYIAYDATQEQLERAWKNL